MLYDFSMPLDEAMMTQRSIRKVTDEAVDDSLIARIVELGTQAPNSRNEQSWEFILVKSEEVKAALAAQNRWMFDKIKKSEDKKAQSDPALRKINAALTWAADNFESYPLMLVACYKGGRILFPQIMGASVYGSLFPAVQNMMLAARASGLGVNLTTMPLWHNRKARKILNIPSNYTPAVLLTFGWPQGNYGVTARKPVGDVLSLDRFGNKPWLSKTAKEIG